MRFFRTARATLLACLMAFAPLAGAQADAVDDAFAHFTTDKFEDTQEAIERLAQTGHATAEDVIAALSANRLFFRPADRQVLYRDAAGAFHDAKTGAAAEADAKTLKPVRLNNRLRRVVEGALGSLTLLAPDPQKRIAAAQAVFRSRDVTALPTIETALAKESDAAARSALEDARAAIMLT